MTFIIFFINHDTLNISGDLQKILLYVRILNHSQLIFLYIYTFKSPAMAYVLNVDAMTT